MEETGLERHRAGTQLDAFLQAAPIGVGRVDATGKLSAFNAEFARLLGSPTQDLTSRTLDEIAPSINDRWRDFVRAARDDPGLNRRTITLSAPSDPRSLDVVAWGSRHEDAGEFVTLLVNEVSLDGDSRALTGVVERARIARDIHDGLAQDIWLAKLAASKLSRHPALDADSQELCTELSTSLDSALAEARTMVMAVRTLQPPTISLPELVERQVDEFSDRFAIRAECQLDAGEPLPARVSVEMLRILQEALNNVRKHANARRVIVRLAHRRSSVLLSVRDDGRGFDPATTLRGFGRQSMHERAQSIGARLTVTSKPDRGTTVTLRVPIAHVETRGCSARDGPYRRRKSLAV